MTAQHRPSRRIRREVLALAGVGIPQDHIPSIVELSPKTLRAHYRPELDTGAARADAAVLRNLYRIATGDGPGAVAAAIFWAKSRCGFSEKATPPPTAPGDGKTLVIRTGGRHPGYGENKPAVPLALRPSLEGE